MEFKYIKVDQYDSFQKMSFRNRYVVSGANNAISLSVPIAEGREQKTLIKDVRINNVTDWQTAHWRTLLSAYSKAPFFDFYSEEVKSLIFSKEDMLFCLDIKVLKLVFKTLKINTILGFTEEFILHYDNH